MALVASAKRIIRDEGLLPRIFRLYQVIPGGVLNLHGVRGGGNAQRFPLWQVWFLWQPLTPSPWVGRDGCGRSIPGDLIPSPHTLPPGEATGFKGGGGGGGRGVELAESPRSRGLAGSPRCETLAGCGP